MRSSKVWPILAFCLAATPALSAFAQQTPSSAPPKLEKLEEGEQPAITIRKSEGSKKITEKRQQGKVTEVKVQSGKSSYYVKPNEPAGSALPGDAQSNTSRPAQWQVLEFGKPKAGKDVEPPQTLAPAAAAEALAPAKK